MTLPYIFAIVLFAVAAGIVGVRFYLYKKDLTDDSCVVTGFIMTYGDQLLDIIKSCIAVMSINPANYTEAELITTLTTNVVSVLKETGNNFGCNTKYLDLISTDCLTKAINEFITTKKIDIFGYLYSKSTDSSDTTDGDGTENTVDASSSNETNPDTTAIESDETVNENSPLEKVADVPVAEPQNETTNTSTSDTTPPSV